MTAITVEPLTGEALKAALPALAELRISVFRAYPYLYEGTLDYEQKYMAHFAEAKDAIIVAARDGDKIIGCATAAPLKGHTDGFGPLFEAYGIDPDLVFYCGESVLLPEYRGHGIGHKFFDEREAQAKRCTSPKGPYKYTAFCGVVRPADHPKKPEGYTPLDAFWTKRGYKKTEGLLGSFSWAEIGETEATDKPMQFWLRPL